MNVSKQPFPIEILKLLAISLGVVVYIFAIRDM